MNRKGGARIGSKPRQSGLLLATTVAALHALAAHLRARRAGFIVRELFARLGARFARLGARFAANCLHRAAAAADRDAQFAKLGAIEAGLHALGVGLVAQGQFRRAVRVALQALGEALGTGRVASRTNVIGRLSVRGESGTGGEGCETGARSEQNISAFHGILSRISTWEARCRNARLGEWFKC